MYIFWFDKYLIKIWQWFETWSRLWRLVVKLVKVGCQSWSSKLVVKVGRQGRSSRLVVKVGCQGRSSRLVVKVGCQDWSSRLVAKIDLQGWSSRLVVKVGLQSWSSRLLSRFLSRLLSLHHRARVVGQFSICFHMTIRQGHQYEFFPLKYFRLDYFTQGNWPLGFAFNFNRRLLGTHIYIWAQHLIDSKVNSKLLSLCTEMNFPWISISPVENECAKMTCIP